MENVIGMTRGMNLSRKASILAPIAENRLGLVQHACSVLLCGKGKSRRDCSVCTPEIALLSMIRVNDLVSHLGVILVDDPIVDGYILVESNHEKQTIS